MFYYVLENGARRYTMRPESAMSVLPAKYSVEDRFSAERVEMKKRCGIYPFDD